MHPIQVVVRRTGISADVLRAWEKRYQAVTPVRDSAQRRMYSDDDIERLRLMKSATLGGRRIGDVARMTRDELTALVEEDRAAASLSAADAAASAPGPRRGTKDAEFLGQAIDATRRADAEVLRAVLGRAVVTLTPSRFIDLVATPLMHEVGALWERGELTPGHEHMASEVLRRVLSELMEMVSPPQEAPMVVIATPSGQRHGLGALLAASVAALEGWRVTYLGTDLPAQDIARVALDASAQAVAISVTAPDSDMPLQIAALRSAVGSQMPILVGGQQGASLNGTARHVIVVRDLESFRLTLRSLSLN